MFSTIGMMIVEIGKIESLFGRENQLLHCRIALMKGLYTSKLLSILAEFSKYNDTEKVLIYQ